MFFAINPRCTLDQDNVFDGVLLAMSRPTLPARISASLRRRRESQVHDTDKEFRIRLELRDYKADEVRITSDKKHITVTAKHEEKEDNHGFVSRKITRTYKLPDNIDLQSLKCSMNSQGVLCIKGNKKEETCQEIPIPVEYKNSRDW